MWLLIILLIPVVILIYLLFAPFLVEIDSERSLVRFRFHRLASTRVFLEGNALIIELKIPGWKKRIDLLEQKERVNKPVTEKRDKKAMKISFRKVKSILGSFKVNTCYVNLDFEDPEWNVFFLPVFVGLSRITGKSFNINFIEKNEIKLEIENTIARMGWAYLFK